MIVLVILILVVIDLDFDLVAVIVRPSAQRTGYALRSPSRHRAPP